MSDDHHENAKVLADSDAMTARSRAAADPPVEGSDRGDRGYHVELPNFEGPLDLLLHLIQEHELDILDIPVAFVTERYVQHISLMEELNIDVASEYLVMAATLTYIKSRMLLPATPDDQQDEAEPDADFDPRAELVRRLLEYQKYKQAAEELGGRSVFGRDVFARGMPIPTVEGPAPLARLAMFKLFEAFRSVLERAEKTGEHEVQLDHLSITERINELVDLLRDKGRCPFVDLFAGQRSRSELILTFLALLEMTRLRMVRLYQDEPLAEILVEPTMGEPEEATAPDHLADDDPSQSEPRGSEQGAIGELDSGADTWPRPAGEQRLDPASDGRSPPSQPDVATLLGEGAPGATREPEGSGADAGSGREQETEEGRVCTESADTDSSRSQERVPSGAGAVHRDEEQAKPPSDGE